MTFQHFSHDHALESKYSKYGKEGSVCKACSLPMLGPFYSCQTCNFDLHKSCAELPTEKVHPFHNHHSLTLLSDPPADDGDSPARCDGCGNVTFGFVYHCSDCKFNLDTNCASLTDDQCQELKQGQIKNNIFLSFHEHQLSIFNHREEISLECAVCHLPDSGPAYRCMDRDCRFFFLHISCSKLPEVIQHPYHRHPLSVSVDNRFYLIHCNACEMSSGCLFYGCRQLGCSFRLHYRCAEYLTTPLKLNRHVHNLFYFNTSQLEDSLFFCKVCDDSRRGSVYRCVENRCNFNLHSECVPVPQQIKHDHIHTLTYVEPVVDDVDGPQKECYCHCCETERNPNFPYYNCALCRYDAHIGCVLSESEPTTFEASMLEEIKDALSEDRMKDSSKLKEWIEEETAKLEATEVDLAILEDMWKELESERHKMLVRRAQNLA